MFIALTRPRFTQIFNKANDRLGLGVMVTPIHVQRTSKDTQMSDVHRNGLKMWNDREQILR